MMEEGTDGSGTESGPEVTARVLKGSAFILASRIINAVSLFIVSVTLARYLGTDQYGLIAVALGVAGMLEVIGALGMNEGSARYIPYYQAKGQEDDVRRVISINVTTKAGMAIMLATFLYLVAGLLAGFFDKDVETLMQIAAIVVGLNVLGGAFQSILRGFERLPLMAVANVVRDLVWSVTSIGLVVVADMGPEGALWGTVAGAVVFLVIALAGMVIALRQEVPQREPVENRYDRRVVRDLVTFGVPVLLSRLMYRVFDWIGTYVVAFFGTVADVSIYNIAYGIVAVPLVLIKSIAIAMLPAMSRAYGEERLGLMQTLWTGSVKLILSLFMPLATMLMVLAGPAILLIYGEDYVPGASAVIILAPYLFVRPVGLMSSQVLAAMARQDLILRVNVVSMVINLVLSIVLMPFIGIEGVALAVTISFAVHSTMMYLFARSKAGVQMDHGAVTKILVGSVVAMAVAGGLFLVTEPLGEAFLPLFLRLAVATLVALGLYTYYIRQVRIFSEDEMENVRSVAEESKLAGIILRLLGQ
ncbi:MAG: flippase [Thermoplasmata archaeon]|nr:MAG: flippase [Thermoplasmata archaeon]